ncbi:alpha/beta hydrolase, partial [Mycobacterium tuberculosis]|nr:alpha/beta hydrolase [Mycobacterium tuberculosis]
NLPVVVYYHGGGWSLGDLDTHDALCRLTCRDADIQVLSIDYNLPVVVYYHGGGWSLGDLDTHDALCRLTCRDA